MLAVLGMLGVLALGPSGAATSDAKASAGTKRTAVLPVRAQGDLPEHRRATLERTIVKGLRLGSFDVIEPTKVAKVVTKVAPKGGCTDDECRAEVAQQIDARYLVVATIEVQQSDIDFHLELIDGRTGKSVAQANETCEICSDHEAETTARGLGASLSRTLEASLRSDPILTVNSTPRGARVYIDGADVGATPLRIPVEAGKHEVEVFSPSRMPQTRTIEMIAGVEEELTLRLERTPAPSTDRRGIPGWTGWVLLTVGMGATGGGAALLGIHQRPILSDCMGNNMDLDGDCKYRYNTLAGGATLLAGGLMAATGGIALLVVHRRQRAPRSARLHPARLRPGRAGLTIAF